MPADDPLHTTRRQPAPRDAAAIFTQQLQAVGIKMNVELRAGEPELLRDAPAEPRLRHRGVRVARWPGSVGLRRDLPVPGQRQNLGGSNYKLYCNKKVDALIKKGEADLEPDEAHGDLREGRRRSSRTRSRSSRCTARPRSSSTSRRSRAWTRATTRRCSARPGTSSSGTGKARTRPRLLAPLEQNRIRAPGGPAARSRLISDGTATNRCSPTSSGESSTASRC